MPDNVSFRLVKNQQEVSKWYPFWVGTMVGLLFVLFAFLVAVSDISRAGRMHSSVLNFSDMSNTAKFMVGTRDTGMMEGGTRIEMGGFPEGGLVSGKLEISATIESAKPVTQVRFLVDGTEMAAFSSGPYSYTWDTARVKNGNHVFSVMAVDDGGYATLAQQKIIVAN